MNKVVRIPRFLHDIHGREATILGLWATYVAGSVFGVLGAIAAYQAGIELWKAIIVGILFFDVGGGVVANLTSSTNRYYQESAVRRLVFLGLHIIQPILIAVLLGGYWEYALFLAAYTAICGLMLNSLRGPENQQVVAGLLCVAGIACLTLFSVSPAIIYAFGALFMVKILIGFSVRRPTLHQ